MNEEKARLYLEGVNGKEIKLGLERVKALVEAIGRPDKAMNIIHVAGTNGKGSVCQMISGILQESDYKVGCFNSPYFEVPNECISINGVQITNNELMAFMNRLEPILEELKEKDQLPSGFEILTGLALMYFKEAHVDFVILEVGLGGRIDATNVIETSCLSIITKIAMDHTNFLGHSLKEIAREKAGIIKKAGRVVTPNQSHEVMAVFEERCHLKGAKLRKMLPEAIEAIIVNEEGTSFNYQGDTYHLSLIGGYQAYNASLAIEAIRYLQEEGFIHTSSQIIKKALKKVKWPGRFEKISSSPLCFIDGAHNVDGMQALADTLDQLPRRYTIAIIGILKDKEVDEMLKWIAPKVDAFVVTTPLNPRAMTAQELAQKIGVYTSKVVVEEELSKAYSLACKWAGGNKNAQIIGCGSLYMLGGLRPIIMRNSDKV